MTRRLQRWLLFLVLVGVAAGGVWYLTRPKPIAVLLHTLDRGKVQETVSNTRAGTVKACRRSWLAPAVGGQIAELPVKEGDHVKAGQHLLTVWNDDLKARVMLAESESVAARARADEACARADVAEKEAARQVSLRRQKLTSEEQVDATVAEAKAKRAGCRAGRATSEVSLQKERVARQELNRTILSAPFAGVIAEVNGELGEFITPSPPGIATPPAVDLIDDSCVFVSAPIDEVDAPRLRLHQPVCVSLDAFPNERCEARIRRIAPYVLDREKQARTVEVEVEFTEASQAEGLLAGYSADVEVILETRGNVLRVPSEAVLEGYQVLVYRPSDGRLEARTIEPGLSNWQFTEVLSGLKAGEQVVTSVDREGVQAGALVVPEQDGVPTR